MGMLKENRMIKLLTIFAAMSLCATLISLTGNLIPNDAPPDNQYEWWPSRYGPQDTLGAINELGPTKVLEAVDLIKTGVVYDLGTEYNSNCPGFYPRMWRTTIPSSNMLFPKGVNNFTWLEEEFLGCPGIGTQLDGLGHAGIGTKFYNGVELKDLYTPTGIAKYGMEGVPPIVTRGILIDMVSYKGRYLGPTEPITKEDIWGFLSQHGLRIEPGDAVLIYTGWMRYFREDQDRFMFSEPGIDREAAIWLRSQRPVGVGTDQWSTEVVPNNEVGKNLQWPCHQELITKGGIYLFQDLILDKLAADGVYEFAFIFTHPKITGTTQEIGQPIAII